MSEWEVRNLRQKVQVPLFENFGCEEGCRDEWVAGGTNLNSVSNFKRHTIKSFTYYYFFQLFFFEKF